MAHVVINSYDNYVDAHIAKGVLEEHGISSWLKDENTLTINPILTNAAGGIKLMVITGEAQQALEILTRIKREQAAIPCPNCGSVNTDFVSTPRKPSNWFSAFFGFFLGSYAFGVTKKQHCFACGHEFPPPRSIETV